MIQQKRKQYKSKYKQDLKKEAIALTKFPEIVKYFCFGPSTQTENSPGTKRGKNVEKGGN